MRPGAQIRTWLREAPRSQVVATAGTLALAVALLASSFVPKDTSLVSHPELGPSIPGLGMGPSFTAPAAGPGTPVPGESGAPVVAGPSGAPLPSSAGPGGGPAAPGPGGTPGGSPVQLTASDVGVTPTTVTIGFLIVNVFGLQQAGYALGFRNDIEQVIDAYVDDVNDHGGIWGRKVVARKRRTDPVSQDDQAASCTAMVRDEPRVFGVVDSATNIYSATQRCFTIDNHVPFTHSYPMSQEFQAQSGGYDVAANRNLTRIVKDWAYNARQLGWIRGQREKVGIFTDKCEPSNTVLKKVFVPMLRSYGTAEPMIAETDCNPAAQQTQVPNAVAQMSLAGITHVFMATSYVGVQNFLQNAQGQGYRPKYFVSDYDGLVNDYFARDFPPEQWDRVQGVTTLLYGGRAAGRPVAPGTKRCSDILRAHNLSGLDSIENDDAEAAALCEEFFIMVEAARLAGPNFTRASWARAVDRLTTFEASTVHSVHFRPGKHSGGDDIVTVEWRRECKCYVQISQYRPGKY